MEKRYQLINAKTKDKLFEYFFNTMRMYMDATSEHNLYNDIRLFYSLDQNKFLKRSAKTVKPLFNWIEIPVDQRKYAYLKDQLGFTFPKNTLTLSGRLTNQGLVKDELYKYFMDFVNDTFNKFYEVNCDKTKIKTKNENYENTAKQLF